MVKMKLDIEEEVQTPTDTLTESPNTEAEPLSNFEFFPDRENLTEDQSDFINRLENARSNSTGFEQYADFTEFYDEDGAVLLTIEDKDSSLLFNFGDISFEYKDADLVKD